MGTEMKRGSGVASFLSSVESKKEQYNKVPQQSNPNIESWYDGTTAGARLINDVDTNKESSSNIAYLLESALQGAKNSGYGIANTVNEMNKYYDPTMNLDNLNAMADFVANTDQRVEGVKKVRDDLYKAQDSSNQAFNEKYADKQGAIKLAGDVAQGVGGMIPNIAANMLVPGAGMATMFASATGNKYKEAIQDGATDNQALLSGVLSGGVEVATEKLFDGISALGKGLGLEKKITNWLGKRITGPATKQVLEKVIGTLGEGAEEAISEYANAYIAKIYNDNGKDALETFIDTTPDALYSAMIGAITSGVLEGGTNVVSNGAKSFLNKVESAKTQNINSNQPNLADTEQLQQSNVVSGINPNIAQIDSNKPTYNFGTVTKQDIQNLNDLTSKSNTKLEWFEGANDVNGYYQNGTIYLNKNKTSSDNYTTVMVHELSHHLENSGNYEAFKSVVFNNIRQNGLNLDNIRKGIAKDYSNHIENLTDDDIDREVVAKFAEEFLFKDQEAINRLARTDRNLFQKIYDWIKDTIQYVTSNAEKQKLMDIERMYAKALDGTEKVNNNIPSYSIKSTVNIPTITIEPEVVFFEDERSDDVAMYEAQEKVVKDTWKNIIFQEDFEGAEFNGKGKETLILTKSVRDGVDYQLSYFDGNMQPYMHDDCYVKNVDGEKDIVDYKNDSIFDKLVSLSTRGNEVNVKLMEFDKYSIGGGLSSYDSNNRTLSQKQQEYFKDSKVRDANGNLKVMYHGTSEDFTVFNPFVSGGKNGTAEGYGLYFADTDEVSKHYGGKLKTGYLNVKKPASSNNKTIKINDLSKLIKATIEAEAKQLVANGEYENVNDALKDTWISNYSYTYNKPITQAIKETASSILAMNNNDMFIIQEVMSGMSIRDYQSAYKFYDILKDTLGFDGFETEWNDSNDGKKSQIVVAFDSNQFKNIDNTSPTSNDDIRYSIGGKLSNYDTENRQLSKEQQEYFKDSKVRDANGNLKVMYHGTGDGGFHEFDNNFSDDGISFFFVDNPAIAKSYSGTTDEYAARTLNTAEDVNRYFEDLSIDEYNVVEEDGKYILFEDGDKIAESDSAKGIYDEFREWTGYGQGSTNYKVYLNIKNPLVVEANNNYWDELLGLDEKGNPIEGDLQTSRDYAAYAKENGYDGVIFKNVIDVGLYAYGKDKHIPAYVVVAFDSNQIKSVDNTNPTENDDIRYSRGKKLSEYDIKPSQLTQTDLNLANDLAKSFGIQDVSSLENNIRPIAQELESTGRLSVETKDKLYRYVSKNTTGDELFNEMNKGKSDVRHYNFDQAINKYISNKIAEIDSNNYNAQAPIYEPNQGHRATFGNDTYETTPKVESLKMATEKTAKVKDYEKAAKNKLLKYLANQFNMTMYQANNVVGDFIDRAGMQIQTKNKVDSYLVRDIFNKMADNSYSLDEELNKTYSDLINYLKTTKIKVNEDVLDGQSLKDFRDIKRDYKDMLHFSNDGRPIDEVNDELADDYSNWFDKDANPKDALASFKKVVEAIRKQETKKSTQYSSDEIMREGDFIAFNEAYNNFLDSMRNAQNVANEIAAKKELKDSFDYNFYKEQQSKISKLKREYEKVQRKIVLDNKGTHFLNGLMSGAITTDDIDVEYRNDVLSMYRVKKPYEDAKNITKTYQSIYKQGLRDTARGLISSIEGWQVHKKWNGLSFEMDTAERTIRDIAGDDAEPIIKEYFTPIHSNEAEATRFKNKWKEKLKALNLSAEEAAAVQMLGERADIGGREYTEADVVEAGLDLEKITNAVNEFKQMYNELYDQVNEVLVRNGYAAIEFRKDYFPHFIDAEPNTKLGKVLKKFGLNIAQDDLNADIAGLTEHFRPGKTWFGHAMHRTSNLTKYNALEGADRYLDGIANVIYHTDDIQKLRALDTEIRYQASDDGFKAAIDEIYDDENLFEEERQSKLQELYEKQGKVSTFGNLTTWLTNYTNNLANKKSAADRQMEYDLGRGMYTISKQLEGRVAANMVAASASSAMSNFIPITQALGECKATDIVKAMSQTMSTNFKNDGFVDESVFLTNRKGTDKLVKTKLQDLSDSLSIPFEMVDNFVSSTIVRAKYLGNLDKGMTHEQAMQDADSYAASLMADRSKGAMPLVFERKNPVAKMFTMFQLEQNNQINYLLKDLPRAKKEEAATAILMDIMRMAIGAWCFNEINQLIFGRRSALDPIDMAYSSWKTMNNDSMNIIEKGAAIGTEIGQELPFIGGYLGGGRMPISSALPDWNSVTRLADEGYSLEDKVGIATQGIIKPLSYMVSPFGAGQAWKTYEGLKAYNEGGVYNITSSGKKLKYAVDDNIGNLFRAAIGGKSSFPEATEYYDSGRSPLSVKQTAAFEKASSLGADKEQLIEAMYRAKGIDSMKDSNGETIKLSKAAQIRKMLDEYDFTTSQKKALYESIGVSKSIAEMTSLEFKQYVKENNIK